MLTLCLLLIVKVLRSALEGKPRRYCWAWIGDYKGELTHVMSQPSLVSIVGTLATLLKKFINADIPYVPWLTGYVAILVGAVMTFLVQSSSVFTSTLTPLVGVGLITVSYIDLYYNTYQLKSKILQAL